MTIKIILSATSARTLGLAGQGLPELEVVVRDPSFLPEAQLFLSDVLDALREGSVRIRTGETIQCGYWTVRFDERAPGLLSATEPDAENTKFVPGASLALSYLRDQRNVCREFASAFDPPVAMSGIACSDGVLEGRSPVGGTRYRYRDGGKMSGWFLSTDLYDDTNETVKVHHAYHVTAARPDLARYLALSPGHRFDHGTSTRVWVDPEVENEEPW